MQKSPLKFDKFSFFRYNFCERILKNIKRKMKGIFGHIKRHGKSVHQHIKKHHKKYIFGAVSGALGYKVLSIIAATIFANPL